MWPKTCFQCAPKEHKILIVFSPNPPFLVEQSPKTLPLLFPCVSNVPFWTGTQKKWKFSTSSAFHVYPRRWKISWKIVQFLENCSNTVFSWHLRSKNRTKTSNIFRNDNMLPIPCFVTISVCCSTPKKNRGNTFRGTTTHKFFHQPKSCHCSDSVCVLWCHIKFASETAQCSFEHGIWKFFFCRAQETDFLMSPLFIPHVKVFFTEIQNSFHLHVQKKN